MKAHAWVGLVVVCAAATAWGQGEAAVGEARCVPDCRTGFLCHAGRCVSRCNPPCASSEVCLETGECAAGVGGAPSAVPVGQRVNRGWATGAGVLGAVSTGLIATVTLVTMAINGSDAANYTGALAILFTGVAVPLVAVGAGSGRWDPLITGSAPWRVVGWIAYGLAVANALVALGIGLLGDTFPTEGIASLGVLACIGSLSHMADAFITAGQGRELLGGGEARAPAAWHRPLVALLRDGRGGAAPMLGWAVGF